MSRQIPVFLDMPDGRASHVLGSGRGNDVPLYEYADGTRVPIDTNIPDDLKGRWYWMAPWGLASVTPPGVCGVCIAAVTFPPPLCYDQARQHEAALRRLEGVAQGPVVQLVLF